MKDISLNFSKIYLEEGWKTAEVYDFSAIEGTNCYCSEEATATIREKIKLIDQKAIHWIDTGDYHYVSYFFLERINEAFNLLLLDNHPDDQDTFFGEEQLSCGNWIAYSKRKLTNYKKEDKKLPLYISIDLDILDTKYARTNWDQGKMSFEDLCKTLSEKAKGRRILGIDVCGGVTIEKGASDKDLELNLNTRKILSDFLHTIE